MGLVTAIVSYTIVSRVNTRFCSPIFSSNSSPGHIENNCVSITPFAAQTD